MPVSTGERQSVVEVEAVLLPGKVDAEADVSDSSRDAPGPRSLRDHSISTLLASIVLVAALLLRILPFAQSADAFATVVAGFAALAVLSEGSSTFRQWRGNRRDAADHDREAATGDRRLDG